MRGCRRPQLRRIVVGACLAAALATGATAAVRASLPEGIPAAERPRLQEVADAASVATRVDAEAFPARREVFEYLLDHPEFATHVTRTLRVARYRIWNTPEGLYLDDGWGAVGHFRVVYAASGVRVMYARGEFRKPLLPAIHGVAVAVIQYGFAPIGNGRSLVSSTVSGFVKLDSRLLELAIKAASVIAQAKADLEARRLMKVFARVSRAVDDNPAGVFAELRQRPDVPPRELEEFRRLLNLP